MRWRRRLQLAAVVLFIVVYAGLSHYSNSSGQARGLGAGLALAPVLTVGFVLVWRSNRLPLALLLVAAAAALLYRNWPLLEKNFPLVYLVQECGFYGLMAASFGQSLFKGRVAFCTRLADKEHGPLTALEVRYTRHVTAAWAGFFALMLAATLVLYQFAPLRIWSMFANFLALPLVGLMFVAEYAVRRRVLPRDRRRGILATLRVYFAN